MPDLDFSSGETSTPESLLMGAVTSEAIRAEREILAPWLRHAWDIFRHVLDNIRWVPKLEHVYHSAIARAMKFCKDYSRKSEFKKLITTVRVHLSAQRRSQELNGVFMTPEQVERHLLTRFIQLEYCAELSLWVEAFRTVEDILSIMSISETQPKAQLMAAYYEKLSRIFWVSENFLFHAYAWYKFYSLSVAQNKALTDEHRRKYVINLFFT
jgi:translation initiation factor 3 subunit A